MRQKVSVPLKFSQYGLCRPAIRNDTQVSKQFSAFAMESTLHRAIQKIVPARWRRRSKEKCLDVDRAESRRLFQAL